MTPVLELRQQLFGAWSLVSYNELDVETRQIAYPFGSDPKGLLLYTPDGYMSAQLQLPDRQPFAQDDLNRGTDTEYAVAGRTYIAYSGRYWVDAKTSVLTHEMAVAFFPNWQEQTQTRLAVLEGNTLRLSTAKPVRRDGALIAATATWARARSNSGIQV